MNDNRLILEMTHYYAGQPHRIQHFMKVYGYAKLIGEEERIDARTQEILNAASIVHDIGIKKSEEIYGDSIGSHQEELGPSIAEDMLKKLGYDEELIQRVSYLVGHHHTYDPIDGMDYQILVEADFLVNLYEMGNTPNDSLRRLFQTKTGTRLLETMYRGKEMEA